MLSRMAVALVFPMFMGAVCVIRSVILFQRGRKHDKEVRLDTWHALVTWQALNQKLLQCSPRKACCWHTDGVWCMCRASIR